VSESIFISYSHSDSQIAGELARRLEGAGWSVWWDRHIPVGQNFARATEKAIADAKIVITLWSRVSVASDWVLAEAAWANADKKLLPVRLDDVRLPLQFTHAQTIDLSKWNGRDTAELRDLMRAITSRIGPSMRSSKPPPVLDAARTAAGSPRSSGPREARPGTERPQGEGDRSKASGSYSASLGNGKRRVPLTIFSALVTVLAIGIGYFLWAEPTSNGQLSSIVSGPVQAPVSAPKPSPVKPAMPSTAADRNPTSFPPPR